MTRTQFAEAVRRDGLQLATMYAAMCGITLAQTQLWARAL